MSRALRYTLTGLSGAIFGSGALPLFNHILGQPVLTTLQERCPPMAPNTALSICLIGLTLWILAQFALD
jgi:hypothetical protein